MFGRSHNKRDSVSVDARKREKFDALPSSATFEDGTRGHLSHLPRKRRKLFRFEIILVVIFCALFWVQVAIADEKKCNPSLVRWLEDCSILHGEDLHGLDQFRYIPLNKNGSAWLTLGAEARVRYELQDDVAFGVGGAPASRATNARGLLHADFRTKSGFRIFTQFSVAEENGRSPGPRPFDESDIDLAQGFVDFPISIGSTQSTVRLGRQELPLYGNRLVGLRDGAFLRRAFDAVRVDTELTDRISSIAFIGNPVQTGSGAFDDERNLDDQFSGLLVRARMPSWNGHVGGFLFHRDRAQAPYFSVQGNDERVTLGGFFSASSQDWNIVGQAAVQRGETANVDAEAWGFGLVVERNLDGARNPKIGIQLGAASGDDPDTQQLESFDPLYPNLGVFSDAPLYFPTNQINASIRGSANLTPTARLEVSSTLLSRYSTEDAIYFVSGRPLSQQLSASQASSLLLQAKLRWRLNEHVEFISTYVRAEAFAGLRDIGGDDVDFALTQLTLRF